MYLCSRVGDKVWKVVSCTSIQEAGAARWNYYYFMEELSELQIYISNTIKVPRRPWSSSTLAQRIFRGLHMFILFVTFWSILHQFPRRGISLTSSNHPFFQVPSPSLPLPFTSFSRPSSVSFGIIPKNGHIICFVTSLNNPPTTCSVSFPPVCLKSGYYKLTHRPLGPWDWNTELTSKR